MIKPPSYVSQKARALRVYGSDPDANKRLQAVRSQEELDRVVAEVSARSPYPKLVEWKDMRRPPTRINMDFL